MNQRDEYLTKLKAQLDQWNAEVAKWEARTKAAQADARLEYDRQLENFRHQRDEALQHLQKVQAETGEAWVALMRGADDAWAKMKEAFDKASKRFDK